MKLAKSLLLGAAAGLTTVAAASAADLPSRKSAPVEYVKVCNAYGAGFFYIPGTDTCLRVGGMVAFDARAFTLQRTSASAATANYVGRSRTARDVYGSGVLGRIELDARNQTAYGTLRTFVRVDSYYATASTGTAGALSQYNSGTNGSILPVASKDATIVNKAFIQFAGLTAGRAQSMFDFYADAYNNELMRGSNATTNLLAYTATFGGGFSATLSLEDEVARRSNYNTLVSNSKLLPGGQNPPQTVMYTGPYAETGGTRMPDVVANLRVDQGWGSAQLSGALHRVSALHGTAGVATVKGTTTSMGGAYPLTIEGTDNKIGWAVQGGVKINLPMLAAGDALYLQAAYAKGAVSYTNGTNMVFFEGINNQRHPGQGALDALNSSPRFSALPYDCVFTGNSNCQLATSWSVLGALKHYWTPTVSQALFAGYYVHEYPGAVHSSTITNMNAPRFRELRVGTNVFWTPVKGFDIGAELMYMRGIWDQMGTYTPAMNGPPAVAAKYVPSKHDANQLETRIVVRRAF